MNEIQTIIYDTKRFNFLCAQINVLALLHTPYEQRTADLKSAIVLRDRTENGVDLETQHLGWCAPVENVKLVRDLYLDLLGAARADL